MEMFNYLFDIVLKYDVFTKWHNNQVVNQFFGAVCGLLVKKCHIIVISVRMYVHVRMASTYLYTVYNNIDILYDKRMFRPPSYLETESVAHSYCFYFLRA